MRLREARAINFFNKIPTSKNQLIFKKDHYDEKTAKVDEIRLDSCEISRDKKYCQLSK